MEFRFNISPLFTSPIIKVNSNLLPANFRGDRRSALETTTKMTEIINTMGECSAKAQGLSKPVTTAQKLRMSDQNLYLLGDPNAGKNGAVLGLLKVGKKTLYVFDNNGETQTVNAPCVLDFYVHESRQRSGLGKTLFETMLQEENFLPKKLAIDRPSDKLLGFLKKHYGLHNSIPQMNNFVIYEGFFDTTSNNITNNQEKSNNRVEITASSPKHYTTGPCYYSPNTALFGTQFGSEEYRRNKQQSAATNIQTIQNTPVGRYAAPRPACSMAEVFNTEPISQNQKSSNIQQIPQNAVNQSQQQMYQNVGVTNGISQVPNGQNQIPHAMNNLQSIPPVTQQQFNQMNTQPMLQNPNQSMIQPVVQPQNQSMVQNTSQSMVSQSVNQVGFNQSPQELAQQMSFQSTNQMSSQAIPQGMTQPMSQALVQPLTQPVTQAISQAMPQTMPQAMPQTMPQTMPQAMPQTMSQAMPQAMPQTMSQGMPQAMSQIPTQNIPQTMVQPVPQIMGQTIPQQLGTTFPQQVIQGQQQPIMQQMANPTQQVVDQSNIPIQNAAINNKNEEANSKNPTQRRFKANGLSEDPQKSTYVPSTQLQYVQPAGKPSGLNRNKQNNISPTISAPNTQFTRRPMSVHQQQQQPIQPVFQQNQVVGTINQNPDQKTSTEKMDLSQKTSSESFSSLKSRRFKADGLSEGPQRVIHTAKIEVSKMHPAGKPSGMRYSDKTGLSTSSSATSMQNGPTSGNQININEIQQSNAMMMAPNMPSGQNMNNQYLPVTNDQMQIQNLQMMGTPQMMNTQASGIPMQGVQMANPQIISQTAGIPQVANSQVMGAQIVNGQVTNSQAIDNQMLNPQAFVNQTPVAQDMNNIQAVNNIPPCENQNISGQAFNAPINNAQMQNVQPINQMVNPQVMNTQMINSQMINSQAINPQIVATNQQIANNQMGDYQMKNNPAENLPPQMQNPQVINTVNPSEPLQTQHNMNEANKVISNMPTIIHSSATPAKGELKSDEKENETKHSDDTEKQQQQQQQDQNLTQEEETGSINVAIENLEINVENINNDTNNIEKDEQQLQTTNGHANDEHPDIIDAVTLNDDKQQTNIININKSQQYSTNKMHTGLKNISYNVGMAVSPTNKMEFERDNKPLGGHSPVHDNTDAQSTVSSVGSGDGYTDQGYFDLKFYHNKLW